MQVENPSVFSTSYQQTKANQRQSKQDDQKLAFSIFNEKRARGKHEYQMDLGEEQVRHAKTMNPLMESLRLHENELKWGTLDSDIGFAEERTRHAKTMNPLEEHFQRYKNKLAWDTVDSSVQRHQRKTEWDDIRYDLEEGRLMSNLDHQKTSRLQTADYKGTTTTPDQQAMLEKNRALKDQVIAGGLDSTLDSQLITKNMDALDINMSGRVRKVGEESFKEDGDHIAESLLAGKYANPAYQSDRNYDLDVGEYGIRKKGQNLEMQSIFAGEERLKRDTVYRERLARMYEIANKYGEEGKKDEEADMWKRIEMMSGSGLLQGGNMTQYIQGGSK